MSDNRSTVEKALQRLTSGKDIHVEFTSAFEGLDWKLAGARPDGPRTRGARTRVRAEGC